MAIKKTSKEPQKPKSILRGAKDGVPFGVQPQPSPEAKSLGWQELRKRRLLTQEIIKMMLGDDGKPKKAFKDYIASLANNAMLGNPKAIDAVNKCLEEEIIKVANVDNEGNNVEVTPVINVYNQSPPMASSETEIDNV